ncbi:MAG TPA: undecaprenyldiphospho-muramoylpentapeptide beta-N-acetylglucosaminyltransferase, partial [Clostridiales bacterium]|nr:undecaprenyldiphospho-muramoylpentapeptide beta-N-acetylglucosaminyltransferase [Clostridiales bacterium]
EIIREYQPRVVIGTGGYVCGPVLHVAARMGIPTLVHESNSFPGLTTRLLSRQVDLIAVGFKEAEAYLKSAQAAGKVKWTGNPVRREIWSADQARAREKLKLSPDRKLVVFVGGSRGAAHFNAAITEMVIHHYHGEFDILISTGQAGHDTVVSAITASFGGIPDTVRILPYFYQAVDIYAAADLVVCRAGALTVAEMMALGKPVLLVPSPYVAENHQEKNARTLVHAGAAEMLTEQKMTGKTLSDQIYRLIRDGSKRRSLGENARKMAVPGALDTLCTLIEKMARE